MVTRVVNELLDEGLIYEGATGHLPRGRRPTLLHIRARDRLSVAVDVRFSETRVMLSDFGGRELALETFSTPLAPDELTAKLAWQVRLMLRNHATVGACEGMGIVVPGMVNRTTGTIINAPTLGWRDVDLRGAMERELEIPVHIERDAVAGALAQMWHGQRGDGHLDSFVYVTISDGVGAGLVVNGQLARGDWDEAGEFGHIPLSLDGPACLCGARGCWEAYTSNQATIARYVGRELSSRESYAQLRELGLSVMDVIANARSGDQAAIAAVEAGARYIGIGLAGIIKALNPARIIVGGELPAAWDLIGPTVRAAVAERTLSAATAATPILPEPSEADTRLLGAAALVVAPIFAAPQVA